MNKTRANSINKVQLYMAFFSFAGNEIVKRVGEGLVLAGTIWQIIWWMPVKRTEASQYRSVGPVICLLLALNAFHHAVQIIAVEVEFGCQKADAEQFETDEELFQSPTIIERIILEQD